MATIEDEEYEAKLQDLRRHAPFLKSMIDKLRAQERTQQVSKLESLWYMITSNKRLKFETLQKCEDVMLKIQSKSVAGVNKSVQNAHNKSEIKSKTTPISNKPDKNVTVIMNAVKLNIARAKLHDVVTPTPKSPTPDRDLHQHIPISIPMDKVDIDEIASPDPDDDPICWSETSENRYDSARPDVYTNAVMHKPDEKSPFQSATSMIPPVLDINTPPISMQDLQQLEDSIPVEKKRDSEPKKEPPETDKLLKRPSKVSLVPAPIIKPKHKKDGQHCNNTKMSATDKSKVKCNDNKKSVDKCSLEASKSKTACVEHKSKSSSSAKEHKKSSSACSKITSGKDSSSYKSSNHSTVDNKCNQSETTKHHHSSVKHSHDKNKHKESKLHSKALRSEESIEDRASTTMFGSLLSSIDNTLLSEKDSTSVNKKKVPPKPAVKPKSDIDKSNKLPSDIKLASEVPTTTDIDKAQSSTDDKTVFKRLADKYNPRPKKKEPDIGGNIISAKDSTAICHPNMSPIEKSMEIRNSPLLPTPSGPPIFNQQSPLNNLRFSPPSESQFYQKQHYQFNVQQHRPSFNRFDVNSCPDNNRIDPPRSSMEYDLSKMGSADFYNNKSPPFNNRPVEPLLNVIPTDGFPSWNNRDGGHDFQGRKFHPDHPRIDPRLNRQQNVDDTQINRFDNNCDWQGDGNRFFRADDRNSERLDDGNRICMPCDNQFDRPGDSNRFIRGDDSSIDVNRPMRSDNTISLDRLGNGNRFFRQNDTNFDGNRFVRPEDHCLDGSRFVRPEDNIYDGRFVRPEDNTFDGNRFTGPGDNLDRLKDNRPSRFNDNNFDRQGNRFFRPNLTNIDRQGDGNRFVRPGEAKDSIKPFRQQDNTNKKVDGNRFVKSDEKNTSEHDNTVKDKPLSKKALKITKKQEAGRPDQRVQRSTEHSKLKVESSSPSLAIVKRDALDDLYCRINIKDKDEHESFTSPLDSIYEKKQQVTGKGYGVQNFRIPKKPRPQPVVQKCPTPPPERSPTLSRKRSPSPPLRRPPTPPRKRRTISPTERVSTPSPPPNMNDESMLSTKRTEGIPMPEIVAQLPESIRKDDRFGDVVTVLSSLLKDETALTKIKKLLTKGAKNNVSDDDDDDDYNLDKDFDSVGKRAAAKKKTRKLVKRQSKKSTITKKTVTKRSSSVNIDSTSTDTESTQVRRSGRLRRKPIIFDNDEDDDSEDISFETEKLNKSCNDHTAQSNKYHVDSQPALTDEQLDDIVSCMDPFDDFLPDNEADQLVEEALKQPAEKLEEEINKQIVNDIFDSLKNDDNILVPAEDTQKIIDSWGLSDANADKIIDAWKIPEPSTENKITEELFDKDERDEEVSQDNQEDVRNEIDELIKNMPLNDSDKILDCDIVKDNEVVSEPIVNKESVNDAIANCDNVILPKSGTEDVGGNSGTHLQNDNSIPPESSGEQQSACVSKAVEYEIDEVLKPLYTRSLRSSPRVRPPINYADEGKPRTKRLPKKLDTEIADCISPQKRDHDVSLEVEKTNEEVNKMESPKTEPIDGIKVDGANLSTSEILHGESIPTINISEIKIESKELLHLDLVITEMIAKYSGDIDSTIDQSSKILAKKVYKKAGPKSKLKVFGTIQEDVIIKMETEENKEVEECIDKDVLPTNIEREPHNFTGKKVQKRTTKVEPVEDTVNEEKPITRNAKKQSYELDTFQNTENKIVAIDSDVTKTLNRKGKKQNTKALVISENITEETSLIKDSDTNAEAESVKLSPKRGIKKQTNESSASPIEEMLLNEYLEPGAENVPKMKGNKQNTKLLENSERSLANEDVFGLETQAVSTIKGTKLNNSDDLTAVYTFKEDILDSKEKVLTKKGKKQNTSSSLTEENALITDTVSSTESEIQTVSLKNLKKETIFDDNDTTANVQCDALAEGKVTKVSINKQTVNPSDSSERIPMQDSTQSQDVDSDITATIEAESTNLLKIKSIEDLFEEKSLNTEASPLNKNKLIIKKRGRPCKSQAVKKKKQVAESTDCVVKSEMERVKKAIGRPRKKRTELDKLHEDIKETLGDKVLISKRTSLKSPRHEKTSDKSEESDDAENESGKDTSYSVKPSKVLVSPDPRQKVKGLKVVVEQLPVIKVLPKTAKGKSKKLLTESIRRRAAKQTAQAVDNNESDSEGNEGSINSSPETNNQAGNKKRKKRNVWATGFIRSNKKKKIVKSAGDAANQNTEYGAAEDSECSDDIDTDYDVEFVEPDSEHYMIKGKPTKCRLCDFEGVTLVDHYVNNHRAGEVPVSRMCPRDSTLAMEEAEENNYYVNVVSEDLIVKDSKKKKVRFSFTCRFCLQDFPQYSNVQFVDHLATHTGEYRHKCGACDLKNANLRFIKTHYEVVHSNSEKEEGSSQVEVIIPPPLNFHTVFGYMCSECHFVQLAYRSVMEHIQIYHLDESATTIKINMSLQSGVKKKCTIDDEEPSVEVAMETGVFTSQEIILEEELRRVEETNRTELMNHVQKEVTSSRLSSVAALLKSRFDSPDSQSQDTAESHSPDTSLPDLSLSKEIVRLLPKAKAKEPADKKPNLAELSLQSPTLLPIDNAIEPLTAVLAQPTNLQKKYTIFIIGPLKAVVTHSNHSVDFACITDDCVFYTTDREDMANHCKQTHDNRSEKIKCGYCTFAENAVPLLQVFEHICAMHVDPLLVKQEPLDLEKEQQMMEKEIDDQLVEVNENAECDKDVTIAEDFAQFIEVESPSPPQLQFMGNFYGIKITAVTGGVVDDITPNDINESIDQETEKSIENTNEINNELPQLLPINQQSSRVLKKLSNLHNQMKPSTRTTKILDAITVSKRSNDCATTSSQTALTSTQKTFTTLANDSPISLHNFCSISNRSITDNDDLMILTPNTNSIPINHSLVNQHPPPLLLIDDQIEVAEQQEFDSIGNASHILATLAKVSTLPEESAPVSKRRFHTGKTDLLYRCPDAKCGFSSETMNEFELHLRSIGGGHSDLQRMYRCVYCYTMLPLQNYSAHLFYFHGTSEFGCSRCCYRAVSPYHIQLHKNSYHHYDQTDIVLLPLAADVSKDSVNGIMMEYTASKLKSLIKPFSCYCGERFIVTATYSLHLEKTHRNDMLQGGVDCRDCQMKGGKNMVAHYAQVHRNYLYHCAYCSFGTNVAAIDVFNHQSTRHPGLAMDVVVRTIATVDPNNTSPVKNNREDDTIWSKIVRLGNPQATKDLEIIKQLREMESTLISNQQQQSSILLKPASNKFPIHITTTSKSQQQTHLSSAGSNETNTSTKQSKEPSLNRSVIDFSVLSPDPIELDSSTVVEQQPDDTISLLESEDIDCRSNSKAPTLLPEINSTQSTDTNNFPPQPPSSSIKIDLSTPTAIPAARILPRCVTPTNQPIPPPLLNSPISTPEESIFVVLPSSSERNSIPLAGSDLFVCAQCGIHCTTSSVFRTHVHDCVKVDREANTKPYGCAHCDKRGKTSGALLDHMRMHGFPRYRCGLCDFKHTQPWNVRNHMKSEHNISTCVQMPAHPTRLDDDFDDFIYRPRQSQLAPSAHNLLTAVPPMPGNIKYQNKDLSAAVGPVDDAVGSDGSGFVIPMQKYLPTQVDVLPMRAVYTTEVGCGLCGYTSKVRTNIIRHLKLHTDGLAPTDLPTSACVNPVPCLERDELMFDKMTNLAYNSHQAELNKSAIIGRMGGLAVKLDSSASVGIKGDGSGKGKVGEDAALAAAVSVAGLEPPYVPCCKRFVCGAVDCNYLCHDESMFRRHIQALHSHSEVSYRCCHCPPEKTSATPAMLNVELVLRHLRLHGSILYKCTYCPFLHNMKGIMDRHVSDKHMEKNVPNSKAIITVRDFLEETAEDNSSTPSSNQNPPNVSANYSTNSGTRGASSGAVSCETTKGGAPISAKDAKPWRCAMCKVRCVTVEDIINHTNNKHKIGSRYKCGYCDYSNDDRDSYIPHFATHHPDSPILDVITIYFHDPSTHHQQNTANTSAAASAAAALSNNKDDKLFKNDQSPFTDNDASFDTTPLWRKPTTGDIRHIRGILLETRGLHMQHKPAGGQVAAGIEKSGLKRERIGGGGEEETRGTDQGGSPLKKHTKVSTGRVTKRTKSQRIPTSADASLSQEEVFPTSSLVISIPVESNIRYHFDTSNNLRLKDVNDLSIRKMLIKGCLMGKYGDYGRPTERGYLCPKCAVFETNGERQFIAHLFKEMSYMRYQCSGCYTRSSITKTVYMRCPAAPLDSKPPDSDCSIHTCIDVSKEQWALMVLAIQTRIAAHLTANALWGSIDHIEKGGQMEEAGAGANMKGLKLAYGIKGRFHPTDIFPKSPTTRYSQSLPLKYHDEQKQSPQKNSRYSLRHNNTAVSPTEDNVTARAMATGQLMNVFAQVQNLKPVPLLPPVLLHKQAKSRKGAAGECKQRAIEGIQMFPEVVTVGEEEKEVTELSDEDEVEIIDPLVDIVDVDACDVPNVPIPEVIPPPAGSKLVENVTVSNFLPSLGDGDDPLAATDPLMDENTPYSDNDSIGLEIAEDDVAEELEHLQPELSPNKNTSLSTSGTTQAQQESSITIKSVLQSAHQEYPITNTSQTILGTTTITTPPTQIMLKNNTAIPTNDSIPQTTIVASSAYQCDPARGVCKTSPTEDQHEDVSSTTSDSLVLPSVMPSTSAITDNSKGFMATLRPIDPSLVGRLRVIGDASMVGCFGLSSGMSVQVATPLQAQRQAAVDFGGDVGGGGRLVVGQQEGKGIVGAIRSSNIVMYDCQHCNFCTSNMQSLKKHEIRHWVEKPYRCGYVYPTNRPCSYQHYYRSYVVRHAMDSHPRLPGKEVPITFVKITNPTIVSLRRPRNTINDQDSTNSSLSSDSPISAKRLRLVDDDGMDVSVGSVKDVEEEFVDRFTCPNCSYTSHKMRYVLQHLRLHVKCVKCQLCNEKDVQKKRLIDEKCSIHHENIPSRLVIEYDSYELDRLKGLVQKIRVPQSSLKTIEQPQIVDNEEENEFLEVYKTVRSYPKNSGGGSSRTPQRYTPKQSHTNTNTNKTQVITTPLLTTFDIASATYVPLNKQPDLNTLYRIDNVVGGDVAAVSGNSTATGAPIVLNTFLGSTQQQPTTLISTGDCMLSTVPVYAAANFYTTPTNVDDGDFLTPVTAFRPDSID